MTILNGIAPECPRCGYDLRGMAESWCNACPVEGCCAECGLVFAWRASMLWYDIGDYIMMLVIPAFVLLWWHGAVRRYLYMEHSWAVAAAVTVLAMGGGMVIMSSVASGFVEHIFMRLGLV